MHFSLILLHLAGATLLLLFAVHMVREGMERACGSALRGLMGETRGGVVKAAGGGVIMAIMLQLIGMASALLKLSSLLPTLTSYLTDDYATAFLAGVVFTWLIHSSVAAILMVVAFAAQGLLPLEAGVPLVLGANLGAGMIPFWLSRGMPVAAQSESPADSRQGRE